MASQLEGLAKMMTREMSLGQLKDFQASMGTFLTRDMALVKVKGKAQGKAQGKAPGKVKGKAQG